MLVKLYNRAERASAYKLPIKSSSASYKVDNTVRASLGKGLVIPAPVAGAGIMGISCRPSLYTKKPCPLYTGNLIGNSRSYSDKTAFLTKNAYSDYSSKKSKLKMQDITFYIFSITFSVILKGDKGDKKK